MPTFHNIPLHPFIQQRLAATTTKTNNGSSGGSGSGSGGGVVAVPIVTPRAILTRTPLALAQTLLPAPRNDSLCNDDYDLTPIHSLRSQVAMALIQITTTTGKKRRRDEEQQQQQQQQQIRTSTTETDWDACETHSAYSSKDTSSVQPKSWNIPGVTVSAWQQYQDFQRSLSSKDLLFLRTGCPLLDETLLAFPSEWCCCSWRQSKDYHQHQHHHHHNGSSNGNGNAGAGIPKGHVLSLVGSSGSGKTQLALQLALQHAMAIMTAASSKSSTVSCSSSSSSAGVVRYLASSAGHGSLRDLAERCQTMLVLPEEDEHEKENNQNQKYHHDHAVDETIRRQRLQSMRRRRRRKIPCLVPSNLYFESIATTTDLARILCEIEDELSSTMTMTPDPNTKTTTTPDDNDENATTNTNTSAAAAAAVRPMMVVVDGITQLICHTSDDPDSVLEQALQRLKHMARLYDHLWIVVVGSGHGHTLTSRILQQYSDLQLELSSMIPTSSSSSTTTTTTIRSHTHNPTGSRIQVTLTKHIGKVVETAAAAAGGGGGGGGGGTSTTNNNTGTNQAIPTRSCFTAGTKNTIHHRYPSIPLVLTWKGLQAPQHHHEQHSSLREE